MWNVIKKHGQAQQDFDPADSVEQVDGKLILHRNGQDDEEVPLIRGDMVQAVPDDDEVPE